jgi:peptidoglycan/xylan/chitin deacetylase (PgdA/CDA1 family)
VSDAHGESPTRVALTFDAEHPDRPGATAGNVDRILATLHAAQAPSTFFVQGRWSEAEPATTSRIADDGHLIGNHSHYHARMTLLSDEGIRADVEAADAAVSEVTGLPTTPWFRCPFGDGRDDPRVQGLLDDLGYRNVHWHVVVDDWEPWRSAEDIAHDVLDGAERHGDGTVVLLHTWPDRTAEALPMIVDGLRARGADLVRVDDLPEDLVP